jgi:hypothetical protein
MTGDPPTEEVALAAQIAAVEGDAEVLEDAAHRLLSDARQMQEGSADD